MRDLAEFRNLEVQRDGRFRDDRLRTYLAYEDHWPLVIRDASPGVEPLQSWGTRLLRLSCQLWDSQSYRMTFG